VPIVYSPIAWAVCSPVTSLIVSAAVATAEFGIDSPARTAAFLALLAHESYDAPRFDLHA
jgi:predicted chitinase